MTKRGSARISFFLFHLQRKGGKKILPGEKEKNLAKMISFLLFFFFPFVKQVKKKFWQVRKKCFCKDNSLTFVFSSANIFFSLAQMKKKKVP